MTRPSISRRIRKQGAEIIHLRHNRSVAEIVECAIEEDAHGIAIVLWEATLNFKYMKDLLSQSGCGHIKIFRRWWNYFTQR
jgi:methylmalonyl-CoA mutase